MKEAVYCNAILDKCLKLCEDGIKMVMQTYPDLSLPSFEEHTGREEFSLGSRYLHRGFYCPSPDLEYIVTNMRRGKIAKRMTKRTRPTNRYCFDDDGRLKLAETYYPNGSIQKEYIFYVEDTVFGFTTEKNEYISKISIAKYADGKISYYLWAPCHYNRDMGVDYPYWIVYEKYNYSENSYLETEFYNLRLYGIHEGFGNYNKYRFILDDNGMVIGDSIEELMKECGSIGGQNGH